MSYNPDLNILGLESSFSRAMRTVGPLLSKYAQAKSEANAVARARPERTYVPSGLLLSSWVAAKATGRDTSFQSLTRGLPKVRESEITAWRAATGAARSHRPTMNDISAFRRSNVLTPMGQVHMNLAQNQVFGSQWIAKHLSPTLKTGSAAEIAVRLAQPFTISSALERRTRPFMLAAEELNRRILPFKEASELLEQRLRPVRGAAEALANHMNTVKDTTWTQDPRIRAVRSAAEVIDRLARPLGGVYYPPRYDFRPHNPRPTTEESWEFETEKEVGDALPDLGLPGTLSTYPEGTFFWWIDKHQKVIVVVLTAGGVVIAAATLAATVASLYLTYQIYLDS